MTEKILIFTKNWFGDVIMQTPCFRILKDNFPNAKIYAAMPERTQWIVKDNPFINGVMAFNEKEETRSPLTKLKFIGQLRKEKFTRAYLFHRSRTRAFICWAAGIPVRVGYSVKGRRALLTHPIPDGGEACHQTDYFVGLLKASGLHVPKEYFSEFHFSDQDANKVERLWERMIPAGTKRVIALNPGANWEPKRWPVEYFAETADLLSEDPRAEIVITGAEKDIPLADQILKHVRKAKPISLCGKTSLGELGAFLSHCDVVITADSGPMHIASSVGTPVAAIFGPTDSANTGPRGKSPAIIFQENAAEKSDPQDLMRTITPEKVVRAIKEIGWI
ncbi:MAG: lipopolysaccharide heptosyltransferase II [Candidatus Omnitrophica bacterium]|nr:lipopolysaccharide heptosyltransferase II [Candidatus Omnitrophota bacterium]